LTREAGLDWQLCQDRWQGLVGRTDPSAENK